MANEGRPHIGFFGRRNNGKSSLINRLTDQELAIVSDYAGTTTDPVKKSMEIPGIGPSVIIDTAGIDDDSELGEKRIEKSLQALKRVDIGIIVLADNIFGEFEKKLTDTLTELDTPFIFIHNKSDISTLKDKLKSHIENKYGNIIISFSCISNQSTEKIKDLIVNNIPESAFKSNSLLGDVISHGDFILLVTPIDIEAPDGRLILPQVQAIRDILDNDCTAIITKERELDSTIKRLSPKPSLVVTDSQVFFKVGASVPPEIPLTSFSIMLARHKGPFDDYLNGTPKINDLKDGDKIILLESCTHHVSCDDIGRVKIPRWLMDYTGKNLEFEVISGLDDISGKLEDYSMVIQCGGCVITAKQIRNRIKPFIEAGIPATNYGMAISFIQGIYNRAVKPFTKLNDSSVYL